MTDEAEAFVTSTLCATEDPTFVLGKERLFGDTVTMPAVAPPSSRTVWLPVGSLSVIVKDAYRMLPPGSGGGPGVKVRRIVQLWPGWIVFPKPKKLQERMSGYCEGVPLDCCCPKAKSFEFVPVILRLLIVSGAVPVSFTITLRGKLCVLITCPGKINGVEGKGVGIMVACGAETVLFRVTVMSGCETPPTW